ncbi:MAG: hypothetical protein ABEL76_08320 [Bradymonadaceae bacterium]
MTRPPPGCELRPRLPGAPLLAVLLTIGCAGGSTGRTPDEQPSSESTAQPVRPPAAYRRSTDWARPTRTSSAPRRDSSEVLYRASGWAWEGEFVRLDHVRRKSAAASMLDPETTAGPAACPPHRVCGRARLPVELPAEAGFWLALADLFRQRPRTSSDDRPGEIMIHRLESSKRRRRSGSSRAASDRRTVLRELLAFRPTDEIDCRAEFAAFETDRRTPRSSADRALDRTASDYADPAGRRRRRRLLNIAPSPRVHYFVELLRRSDASPTVYELRVWRAGGFDAPATGRGQLTRRTLICRGPTPLFAEEIRWDERTRLDRSEGDWQVRIVGEPTPADSAPREPK